MIILPVWTEIIRMYHKNSYHHVRSEPPWVFRIIRRRVRCGTNSFRAPRGAQIYPAVRRGHSRSGMHSGSSRPHCISLRSAGTDLGKTPWRRWSDPMDSSRLHDPGSGSHGLLRRAYRSPAFWMRSDALKRWIPRIRSDASCDPRDRTGSGFRSGSQRWTGRPFPPSPENCSFL